MEYFSKTYKFDESHKHFGSISNGVGDSLPHRCGGDCGAMFPNSLNQKEIRMKALLILSCASFLWGYGAENLAAVTMAGMGLLYIVNTQPQKKAERGAGCMPVAVLLMMFWLLIFLLIQ